MNLTKVCKEDQFAMCIFICGNPPALRPPAWAGGMSAYASDTFYARSMLTFEENRRWGSWARHCRETAIQQCWVGGYYDWDLWLREFLAWYDEALGVITAEQENRYDKAEQT